MRIPPGRATWVILVGAAAAYETYGVLDQDRNDTLSEATRWAFRTHTPAGKAVFIATWGIFSAWFVGHITAPNRPRTLADVTATLTPDGTP